jgi:hypothetical protein
MLAAEQALVPVQEQEWEQARCKKSLTHYSTILSNSGCAEKWRLATTGITLQAHPFFNYTINEKSHEAHASLEFLKLD